VSIGGLGYLGRGLAVGLALRRRLGALVSRGPDVVAGERLLSKKPFREMGLYPRPLVRVDKPADHWRAVRAVASFGLRDPPSDPSAGCHVSLEQFVSFESCLVEAELKSMRSAAPRKRVSGRPDRTKGQTVFKRSRVSWPSRPLSKDKGALALDKWANKCKSLAITVDQTIASEIRDRIPDPAQT